MFYPRSCLFLLLSLLSGLGEPAWTQTLVINEFLAGNGSTNFDQDGDASDWIELHNNGEARVNLEGFSLTDKSTERALWQFPDLALEASTYVLIWASGKDRKGDELHTNFKLGKSGEFIGLYDAQGAAVDTMLFGAQTDDISMARSPDGAGVFQFTTTPTPAAANVITAPGPGATDIVINELLASNSEINFDEDGDSSDWIELYNRSNQAVHLAGFTLTDDRDQPARWTLPEVTLHPEAYLLVWASGKDRTGSELHTNFKLSALGEVVDLFTPGGQLVDSHKFGAQQQDISLARIPDGDGTFEKTAEPTPGGTNRRKTPGSDALSFSLASGFFAGEVAVELASSLGNVTLRYTTDGSAVTVESDRYSEPILLSTTTVIRARAFDDDTPVSEDISQFYGIDYAGHLPVLSMATDEKNLHGGQGIFMHPEKKGRKWERPVSVNLVEHDGSGFQINAGVRIHGAHSRSYPKKSMRLYFRSDYGDSKLRHQVFEQKDIDEFDQLVVHAGGSFDQTFGSEEWTLLRDPLNHTLWAEFGGVVSAHKPVVLYINGELWGIYMLRERIHDDYLTQNYGVEDADLLEWAFNETPSVKAGDLQAWRELHRFFKDNDIERKSEFEHVQELMELNNFIDYNILQIYLGHKDWPHNNNFFYRERSLPGKWRWILWDAESTYRKPKIKSLVWATRDTVRTDISRGDSERQLFATIFMRKLVENEAFNARFASRFADLLNTTLQPDHIRQVFEQLLSEIEPDIPLELDRWQAPRSHWLAGLAQVRDFISRRDDIQWNQIKSFFRLQNIFELTVQSSPPGSGQIRVNTLAHADLPWTGKYFKRLPVEIEAIPAAGFEFSHWSGAASSDNSTIELNLRDDETLTAHFQPIVLPTPVIDSFRPDSGEVGAEIAILGRHLGGATEVTFAGTQAAFSVVSETEIRAVVPESAKSGKIGVVTPGGSVQSPAEFVVTEPAAIASFTPTEGVAGTTVTIKGKNFDDLRRVRFGSRVALIPTLESSGEIRTKVPFGAESGPIAVITARDSVVSDSTFAVLSDTAGTKFFAAEDAYIHSGEQETPHGDGQTLQAASPSGHDIITFLKFDLSGLQRPVKKAVLRLCVVQGSLNGGAIHTVANDWSENEIVWTNAPPVDGEPAASFAALSDGEIATLDVTAVVTGGDILSLAVVSASADTLEFVAKEGNFPAQLVVELDTLVTTAPDSPSASSLPDRFSLSSAYPNPFNAETTIEYALAEETRVRLLIYNLVGQVVRILVDEFQPAGFKKVRWAGRDDHRVEISSGVYFVRLVAGGHSFARKILLQK